MITLRNKIKKIVENDTKVDDIMGFIFWEVTKLEGRDPKATDVKVKKLIRYLANNK